MANRDDILQKSIALLESGTPLQDVLDQLPPEDTQLHELIRLTAAIRAVPALPAIQGDERVYNLIQAQARRQARNSSRRWRPSWPDFLRRKQTMPRLAIPGLALVALTILVFIWFMAYDGQVQSAHALTITSLRGEISVTTDADTGWQPAHEGLPLTAGQRLRSGPASMASLQFADGSRLHLAANSELAIVQLEQRQAETMIVELVQPVGQTRHQVNPARTAAASYLVHTPSGSAEVRGTTFTIAVAADGHAYVAVDEGSVLVKSDSAAVTIGAGRATQTQLGQAPAAPVHYFRSQGELLRQGEEVWQVDDRLIDITPKTILNDAFVVGDLVQISGQVLRDGRWQAYSVELATDSSHQAAFAGVLQVMTPRIWLVDGISVGITAATEQPAYLSTGDLIRVVYTTGSDGRRLAQLIELLEPADETTRLPRPSLIFKPDELEVAGCQTSYRLTGSLTNRGDNPHDAAADVELGYTLVGSAQFVEAVSLDPAGWATLASGDTVTVTVQVDLLPAWLEAGPETELKLRLYIVSEANHPYQHFSRLTMTLVQSCAPPTPTAAPTATPLPTQRPPATPAATMTARPSPVPTLVATATSPAPLPSPTPPGTDCTGVFPHPEGLRLAQVYGVPYAEIIGWFCDGFGFGDIDLAYGLAQDSGAAVATIFAMRRQGLSWGEIMQALGLLPGPTPTPVNPTTTPPATAPPAASSTPPPTPTEEPDDGPPPSIIPPVPSMTPPTPPPPPAPAGGGPP